MAPEAQLMQGLLSLEGPARASGLRELQASWRQAFYDALQPTHLPVGWDVHHDPFAHAPVRTAEVQQRQQSGGPAYDRATGDFIDSRLDHACDTSK
jgi:hypothetical protein